MTRRPIRWRRRRLRSYRPLSIQLVGTEYLGVFVGAIADHVGLFGWVETAPVCGDVGFGAVVCGDRIAHAVVI